MRPAYHQIGAPLQLRMQTHRISPVTEAVPIMQWIATQHCDQCERQAQRDEKHFEDRQVELCLPKVLDRDDIQHSDCLSAQCHRTDVSRPYVYVTVTATTTASTGTASVQNPSRILKATISNGTSSAMFKKKFQDIAKPNASSTQHPPRRRNGDGIGA